MLLVVGGGIAAYKVLELIRAAAQGRLRRRLRAGPRGCAHFVTPLSLQALSEQPVHQDLWSLTGESEMGHIELSRAADLVVVAPASADLLARMAAGLASDLATHAAAGHRQAGAGGAGDERAMWEHAATLANLATLRARGVAVVGPDEGPMACGEFGFGRLSEPAEILAAIAALLGGGPLHGAHALVTAGPTHEPIDPVRYLGNRSSGRQGFAVAEALAGLGGAGDAGQRAGGPPRPARHRGAARADGGADAGGVRGGTASRCGGVRRGGGRLAAGGAGCGQAEEARRCAASVLSLVENPDILATMSRCGPRRPRLVVGFAAETEQVEASAVAKRQRKGCDWIVANDVSSGVFGAADNAVLLVRADGVEHWPMLPKSEVGRRLAQRIAAALA